MIALQIFWKIAEKQSFCFVIIPSDRKQCVIFTSNSIRQVIWKNRSSPYTHTNHLPNKREIILIRSLLVVVVSAAFTTFHPTDDTALLSPYLLVQTKKHIPSPSPFVCVHLTSIKQLLGNRINTYFVGSCCWYYYFLTRLYHILSEKSMNICISPVKLRNQSILTSFVFTQHLQIPVVCKQPQLLRKISPSSSPRMPMESVNTTCTSSISIIYW